MEVAAELCTKQADMHSTCNQHKHNATALCTRHLVNISSTAAAGITKYDPGRCLPHQLNTTPAGPAADETC